MDDKRLSVPFGGEQVREWVRDCLEGLLEHCVPVVFEIGSLLSVEVAALASTLKVEADPVGYFGWEVS